MDIIRPVTVSDASALLDIYGHYILNTTFTTEEVLPAVSEMAQRVERITRRFPWIVFESDGVIMGYSYADIFRLRSAYSRTAEVSIYVHPDHTREKIGARLYTRLFQLLKTDTEIHTMIASITLPNENSVRLHESFGFIKKAHLNEVGYKFGCWMDVGLWHRKV